MSADAVFTLTSEFDTQSLIKSAEDAVKEVKKIFESRGGAESPRLASIYAQIEKICNHVIKVGNELNKIGSEPVMTKEFASAGKELDKLERKYDRLISKSEDMYAINEKYNALQDSINEKEAKRANATAESEIAYQKLLEDIFTGKDSASSYSDYAGYVEKVRSIETEIANLQAESQKGEFLKASRWTRDVSDVTTAIRELRSVLSELEEQNQAYIPGTETDAYNQKILKLHEYLTALGIAEKKLDAYQQKEIDKAKDETILYTELLRKREEARQKSDELAAQVTANEQIETNAVFASTQERIQAYEAEIVELDKRIAKEEQAAQHADVYNNSYNRVRESLMGIQSTARGLTRLIPGLETSALQGVVAVTRGVARLADMGKDAILGALKIIKQAFMKLFALIAAHPIISALTGVAIAITTIVVIIRKAYNELKEKIADFLTEIGEATETVLSTALKYSKAIIPVFMAMDKAIRTVTAGVIVLLAKGVTKLVSGIVSLSSSIENTVKEMVKLENGINDINNAVSNLISSLSFLENAFGAVFANALTMVEPMLTQFIDLSAEAINAVGMLFAKLLGADSYTKVIRKQRDYNKELDKTNNKTKEQLAQFDKLNVISKTSQGNTKNKENTSDYEAISLELMTIDELIDNVKGKGTEMGQSLKDTLADINWDQVVTDAGKAGRAIGGFITEFQSVEGLDIELGEALAGIFNAFVSFFNDLGEEIDAFELGQTLGTIVNTFLSNLDTKSAGELITKVTNGIVNAITGFISTIDGYQVGKTLADILNEWFNNFDFEAFGEMLSGGLDTLVDALRGWLDNFSADEMAEKLTLTIEAFIKGINWYKIFQLVDLVAIRFVTFFNTILTPEKMKRVGEVLSNTIYAIFRGFKIIASEARWQEWGEALAAGIAEVLNTLDFKEMAETAGDIAIGILNMLTSALSSINWNTFGEKLVTFISGIKWDELGNSLVNLSQALMDAFNTVWSNLEKSGELDKLFSTVAKIWVEKEKWTKYLEGIGEVIEKGIADDVYLQRYEFGEVGKDISHAMINGITSNALSDESIKQINDSFIDMWVNADEVSGIVKGNSKVASIFSDAGEALGKDITDGMSKGMSEQVNSNTFQTAMDKVTADAEKAMRERTAWNSHSPAQSMIPLGKDIVDGIVKGMTDYDFTTAMTNWYTEKVSPWFTQKYWTTISKGITDGIEAQMKITKNAMLGQWVLIKEKSGEKVDKIVTSVVKKFNSMNNTITKNNNSLKNNFVDTWKNLSNELKAPFNSIISTFESFTNKIIDGMNLMIRELNKTSFSTPDWLGENGNKSFTFNASTLSHVSIPKLAQGTVIPPNMSQFLAVLGDNKKETEVVSPLSTIEQALRNVMSEQKVTFEIVGDPHGMFRVMQKEAGNYTRATGRLAF